MSDQEINDKICDILGLNKRKVASIKMIIASNAFPIATVELLPSDDQLIEITQLIAEHGEIKEVNLQYVPLKCGSEERLNGEIILTGLDTIELVTKQAQDIGLVRPINCRNRLQAEGKPYPRSG